MPQKVALKSMITQELCMKLKDVELSVKALLDKLNINYKTKEGILMMLAIKFLKHLKS